MCHCEPEVEGLTCCGKTGCVPHDGAINHELERMVKIAHQRSQEIFRDKGRDLSFNNLLADIYFQAYKDTIQELKIKGLINVNS